MKQGRKKYINKLNPLNWNSMGKKVYVTIIKPVP